MPAPLRVLYVARAPFISGAERALLSMLRHLDRTRIEPALVLGTQTELVDLARALDIPVHVIALPKRGLGTVFSYWRSSVALARVIRQFRPGLLHANDVPSCQAMSELGARQSVPRLVHVRWQIAAQDASWWARGGAEAVICISQWMRAQLGDTSGTSLEKARVEVLPDCVDWPAEDAAGAHAALPSDSDRVTLGFAGQLIEAKGLDIVIEALGRLPAERRPRLLVAGEDTQTRGAYRQRLQALAEHAGVARDITWLGFLTDIGTLYRQVDAVVCPSRVEPLGLVPLEAARHRVPALASKVGGLAETIEHDVTGWLAEPTVDAWAALLPVVFDEARRRRAGHAAHARTVAGYSPAVYQQRLLEIYDAIA